MSDNGEIIHIKGWVLLLSPELLYGTDLGRRIDDYHFFSYYEGESLHPMPDEQRTIEVCFRMIRQELRSKPDDEHLRRIIIAYLELILEYCSVFYERQLKDFLLQSRLSIVGASSTLPSLLPQFKTETTADNDLLKRFDDLLRRYYGEGRQRTLGLPTVRYCAQELFLSPRSTSGRFACKELLRRAYPSGHR